LFPSSGQEFTIGVRAICTFSQETLAEVNSDEFFSSLVFVSVHPWLCFADAQFTRNVWWKTTSGSPPIGWTSRRSKSYKVHVWTETAGSNRKITKKKNPDRQLRQLIFACFLFDCW
jgi:hypothetical protein